MTILEKLQEIFPDAPRITEIETQTGSAVWDTRYLISGNAVIFESRRGSYDRTTRTFLPQKGTELRASNPSAADWDAARIAALDEWAKTHAEGFKARVRWSKNCPNQTQITTFLTALQTESAKLQTRFPGTRTEQAKPTGYIAWHASHPKTGTFARITLEETPSPTARIEILGQAVRKPLDFSEPTKAAADLIEEVVRLAESPAKSPDCEAERQILLGGTPWKNWTLGNIEARPDICDEWLSTTVKIEVKTPTGDHVTPHAAATFLADQKPAIELALAKIPAKTFTPDRDDEDSPRITRFPTATQVLAHALRCPEAVEVRQKPDKTWEISIEDSDR